MLLVGSFTFDFPWKEQIWVCLFVGDLVTKRHGVFLSGFP